MENIVRKGEIACNKQCLLFSQCFLFYMALIFSISNALENVCNLFQFGPVYKILSSVIEFTRQILRFIIIIPNFKTDL